MQPERAVIVRTVARALAMAIAVAVAASAYEVDTTRVRPPAQPKEKNLGQHVLTLPQLVLDVPIWTIKTIADVTVNELILTGPTRRVASWLSGPDRVWGFFPAFGYGSNLGYMGGLTFTSREVLTKGERLRIKATYSTHDYRRLSVFYSAPSKFGSFRRPYLSVDYRRQPRESFYGLGNNSERSQEVAVDIEKTIAGVGWHFDLRRRLRIDVHATYEAYNLYNGDDPDREGDLDIIADSLALTSDDLAPARLWTTGVGLTHDDRDHPGQTTAGGFRSVELTYHHGVGRSRGLEYMTARLNIRQFVNLYKKRVLGLRVLIEEAWHQGNSPPRPFYLQSALGGGEELRGFRSRRFVDDDLALASLEYRYPIWDAADAFIFWDEGRVFESVSDEFTWRGWHWSTGLGLRIWRAEGLRLSTWIAICNEEPRYYLRFSESL